MSTCVTQNIKLNPVISFFALVLTNFYSYLLCLLNYLNADFPFIHLTSVSIFLLLHSETKTFWGHEWCHTTVHPVLKCSVLCALRWWEQERPENQTEVARWNRAAGQSVWHVCRVQDLLDAAILQQSGPGCVSNSCLGWAGLYLRNCHQWTLDLWNPFKISHGVSMMKFSELVEVEVRIVLIVFGYCKFQINAFSHDPNLLPHFFPIGSVAASNI